LALSFFPLFFFPFSSTAVHLNFPSSFLPFTNFSCFFALLLAAGKTSLVRRKVQGVFLEEHVPTVGTELLLLTVSVTGSEPTDDVRMRIWDCGHAGCRNLITEYCRHAAACIVCLDLTSQDSFVHAQSYITLARALSPLGANLPLFLVGTKADRTDSRVVSEAEAMQLAQATGATYVEVSARLDTGVHSLFGLVAAHFDAARPGPVTVEPLPSTAATTAATTTTGSQSDGTCISALKSVFRFCMPILG
jgi:hypothetical protein